MEAPKTSVFEHTLQPAGFEAVFQHPLPGELCWYDCHPLPSDVPPVSMPLNCPEGRVKQWRLHGKFCSWSCCRSYNFEFMHDSRCSDRDTWIMTLAYQVKFKVTQGGSNSGHHRRLDIPQARGTFMRSRVDIPFAQPRLRLRAFGGDLTIEKFREPVNPSDHFVPVLIAENARILQTSNLDDIYQQETVDQLKKQREWALRIEPENCRLAMHARAGDIVRPLPSVDSLRERAKLPLLGTRHFMAPFDPATERSPMEEKMTAPKPKRGFFASSQLNIQLTTAPVPALSHPGGRAPPTHATSLPPSMRPGKRAKKS